MQVDCNVKDTGIYTSPLPVIFLTPETGKQYEKVEMQIRSAHSPLRDYPQFKSILVVLICNCLESSFYDRFGILCSKVILCLSSHFSLSCHSLPKDVEADYQLFGCKEMSHGLVFFF